MTDVAATLLEGFEVTATAASPPAAVCLRRLGELGATVHWPGRAPSSDRTADDAVTISVEATGGRGQRSDGVECHLRWAPGVAGVADERTVQAACGLWGLHGRQEGAPTPLGIGLASAYAGVTGVQAILACVVGRQLGHDARTASTSACEAVLTGVGQYLAMATCSQLWEPPRVDLPSAPGPPFRAADGRQLQLEALDPQAWAQFWDELGAPASLVQRAWLPFVYRYATAQCWLPQVLHDVAGNRTTQELIDAARRSGASACPVRSPTEALASLDGDHHPGHTGSLPRPWYVHPVDGAGEPPPRPESGDRQSSLPLAGVRVIESTRRIQGPLVGLLLQHLGAEVIRIEPPGGDPLRLMDPVAEGCSARFRALNRDKRVVELDLKQPSGRQRLMEMVTAADVFVHNWAAGTATKLGLDARRLTTANPWLVYGHAVGWGGAPDDPATVGTGQMVQAHSGLGSAIRPLGDAPRPSLVTVLDVFGAMTATEGILAGLVRRGQQRGGAHVETSLLASALWLQHHTLETPSNADVAPQRIEGRSVWGPLDYPIPVSDGYLAVSRQGPADVEKLQRLCLPTAGGTEPATEHAVRQAMAGLTCEHWDDVLRRASLPACRVARDVDELAKQDWVARLVEDVGGCLAPTSPWTFR